MRSLLGFCAALALCVGAQAAFWVFELEKVEALADRLTRRERDLDERCCCLECRFYLQGQTAACSLQMHSALI